eukprot:TRINITY_DN10198_c0_g2_i1.p1 TRINITY_DN10198_c0_g2~~TRINITY_DN10198_c0_g2_i1.p1  ORF type:complete len:515 (+),score=64.15 TRINITY_DN10198_c0_g2_i1:65-1546(+)
MILKLDATLVEKFKMGQPSGTFGVGVGLLVLLAACEIFEAQLLCIVSLVFGFLTWRTVSSMKIKRERCRKFQSVPDSAKGKDTNSWSFYTSSVGMLRRLSRARAEGFARDSEPKALRAQTLYGELRLHTAVSTLLRHGYPTSRDQSTTDLIVGMCLKAFARSSAPVLSVRGFPSTSLLDNNDVATPEMNVSINADVTALSKFFQSRARTAGSTSSSSRTSSGCQAPAKQLLRSLCDILTTTGQFIPHFWMHKGEMPQFVVRIPASKIGAQRDLLANIFLNNPFVEWQHVLDSACLRLGSHEAQLAFFVRRWSRERGIAFVMKGHLSPFTWTLLVLHFLRQRSASQKRVDAGAAVINLFVEFISFYSERLLNHQEAISVAIDADERSAGGEQVKTETSGDSSMESIRARGLRTPMVSSAKSGNLPSDSQSGLNRVLPRIENPFDRACDLGACMNSSNVARLWEELMRASRLLEDRSTLTLVELLAHWSPPVAAK